MLNSKAPEIIQELLSSKEKTHKDFLEENKEKNQVQKFKFYFLFRENWEQDSIRRISKEMSEINGVS